MTVKGEGPLSDYTANLRLASDGTERLAGKVTVGSGEAGAMRFAADLGDPVAAWNVVLYQLRSEQVVKDNAVLMTYLEKAAAGGLPYARVIAALFVAYRATAPRSSSCADSIEASPEIETPNRPSSLRTIQLTRLESGPTTAT